MYIYAYLYTLQLSLFYIQTTRQNFDTILIRIIFIYFFLFVFDCNGVNTN